MEYWTLDGAGTVDAVTVRLFWEDAFRSGLDEFSTDLQVATFTGTQWETAGNGGLGGSLNAGSVVSTQPINAAGAFTLGSLSPTVNPLSSQLATFTANQASPSVVALTWTLTNETNTYGYAVERSADATTWQQIGFVASQGLTAQPRVYTYQDQTVPNLSQAFYRLRQTVPTGGTRYSAVTSVALTGSPLATTTAAATTFALFPNPASGQVTLRLPASASSSTQMILSDLSGRLVLTQALRSGTDTTISLPASLAAGVYLLQVQGSGFSGRPQRLVIQ